jgi:hypothetical protein
MQPQSRHIERTLLACTAHEWRRGKAWYPKAHKWCALVARRYGVPVDRVAGVLAALSPQTSWTYNLTITRRFFATSGAQSGQTRANAAKALCILQGASPLDVLGGHKVRNFYLSIVGDGAALCLDRHAYSLACGRTLADVELAKAFSAKKRQRATFNAYNRVAEEYGLRLSELQAITWLTWRRIKKLNIVCS